MNIILESSKKEVLFVILLTNNIKSLERMRTYLLIAVQVVLVVGAHSGMCIVTASLAALTRVQTSHHPRIQI